MIKFELKIKYLLMDIFSINHPFFQRLLFSWCALLHPQLRIESQWLKCDELYKEIELRFYSLETERQLRKIKLKLRELAHEALVLRSEECPEKASAEQWYKKALCYIKKIVKYHK